MIEASARRQIIIWLSTGCLLIFLMVLIGGITRLTGSGLSMTDWKLIAGSVPPSTEVEWQASFEAYQQFPEFQVQPPGFDLNDYKSIFWWEYIHRVLGRLIGIVFLLPFLYFLFTKKIRGSFVWKLVGLFALGGLQGFFGWFMVKSGLVDNPHVSHYRLAIHLVTAFLTFAYTFWLILSILFPQRKLSGHERMYKLTGIFIVLAFVQIIWGAFTAGLKAGLFYNSFPKMGDQWIADGVTAMTPFYLNFIEGIAGVQFVHRYLGIALLVYGIWYFWKSRKLQTGGLMKEAVNYVMILIFLQVLLGIFALIFGIPLSLALIHQIGAFFLLMTLIFALRLSRYDLP